MANNNLQQISEINITTEVDDDINLASQFPVSNKRLDPDRLQASQLSTIQA